MDCAWKGLGSGLHDVVMVCSSRRHLSLTGARPLANLSQVALLRPYILSWARERSCRRDNYERLLAAGFACFYQGVKLIPTKCLGNVMN